MQGKTRNFSSLSNKVIGCAIEVHRHLGPGLLESSYARCCAHEFALANIVFEKEHPIPVVYKGIKIDCGYRVDFLIENQIVVELKSVSQVLPVHEAQLLTYMKLAYIKQGFLINFNVKLLKNGLHSYVL